jgi:transglutaminase-like putative cysteine protease
VSQFRKWAEHGCRQYGSDPWFFIRELAQNSRDAGARAILVEARNERAREVLAFEDDGTGMSLEHARRYLFRLYASSKEEDGRSAGKYGIGFWSVLRFAPSRILVESRTRREGWAIQIDGDFRLEKVECTLGRQGTRITLERPATGNREAGLEKAVREGLDRYCRYLRRNDRESRKLPVLFNGRNLTRSMRLPGPVSLSFKEGPVEGAVGLAETPAVHLHARGLPVWRGLTLEELSHNAGQAPETSELAHGLCPVFLLNGNDLNVIMSRRAVIDDTALARVRKRAKVALSRLLRLHMDQAFPRTLPRRILDALERTWSRLPRPGAGYAVAAILALVLAGLAATRLPDLVRGPATLEVSVLPRTYGGPVVGRTPGKPAVSLDLAYEPGVTAWFKILTADIYDPERGFVPRGEGTLFPIAPFTCSEGCLDVTIRLDRGGRTNLPLPGGYAVDISSVTYAGRHVEEVRRTASGDTVALLADKGGVLEYTCGPPLRTSETREAETEGLAGLPDDLVLPPEVQAIARQASGLDVETRVATALVATRTLVSYDDSTGTARAYAGIGSSRGWLPFVLALGKGDCDVLNGLNVILLRKMGLSARLAVGVLGHDGRALPEMHAWTEYHDGSAWRVVDATPPRTTAGGPPAGIAAGNAEGGSAGGASAGPVPPATVLDGEGTSEPGPGSGRRKAHIEPRGMLPSWIASLDPVLLLSILVLLALAGCVLGALLLRRPRWIHMQWAEDPLVAEQILARIVTSAASQPGVWGQARELWFHEFLPTVDGRRLSVNQARKLAGARRLFIGSESTPIVAEASLAGAHVLDRGSGTFGPFMERLAGVIDLDLVASLAPVEAGGRLAVLLDGANAILERVAGVRVTAAPGLTVGEIHDVDLRSLPAVQGWPRAFVALNPSGDLARGCVAMLDSNPELAAYRLIERLSRDSHLVRERGERVRYEAARTLVGGTS